MRKIGIPHVTQVKMIRVWGNMNDLRQLGTGNADSSVVWQGDQNDGCELATFNGPPHLTIDDKVLLTNTTMTKAGKPTTSASSLLWMFSTMKNEMMNMCRYTWYSMKNTEQQLRLAH